MSRKSIHPLTEESIRLQDSYSREGGCGCERRADRWWLCDYHDGFEDALDVAAGDVRTPTKEADR